MGVYHILTLFLLTAKTQRMLFDWITGLTGFVFVDHEDTQAQK